MSAAAPSGPIIVLSHAPMDSLWVYCPGNSQPAGSAHPNPTYIGCKPCKPKSKMGEFERSYMVRCDACGFMGFIRGPYWKAAMVTRAQIVQLHGSGRAMDGKTGQFL